MFPQQRFFDKVFGRVFGAGGGRAILDAGCGLGHHTVRLARLGWHVHAVDFSPAAVAETRRKADASGLPITVQQDDLTDLSLSDGAHEWIVCWGVLMHVPDVAAAVNELARVLAPGGTLVLSELNASSPESRLLRWYAAGRGNTGGRVPAGAEHWYHTEQGPLLIRHANAGWYEQTFRNLGVRLDKRLACQFTETQGIAPLVAPVAEWVNERVTLSRRFAPVAASNLFVFRKVPR